MNRVLSLLPSATEMVWALEKLDVLVGRSHECDFPSQIKKIPAVTASRVNPSQSSGAINADVQAHLKDGLSLFDLNVPLMKSLKPDLILTQSHCPACAVTEAELRTAWAPERPPTLLTLNPQNLEGVWAGMEKISDALGIPEIGRKKTDLFKSKIENIRSRARRILIRPKVAMVEWIDPLMASGNWVPELVDLAGGSNLFGQSGRPSAWLRYEDLRQSDPDVICFLPCGFDIKRTRDELVAFSSQSGWFDLKAVHNNRVFIVDGQHYFNRPGPRLIDSLEIMAEILHPDEFDFGHRNDGWQYWGFDRF